jgi:TolB-like protein
MGVPLLAELKRRRIFRAVGAYAIVTFAVLQVIEPIMHGLKLPEWTLSFVVVILAVGFPVVLVAAWIFDFTAGGVERTLPLLPEGLSHVRLALAGVGFVALAILAAVALRGAHVGRDRTVGGAAPSIAVLPFVNMSPANEEYFSDGITEEVINALANVPGLRVVSRTSAFAYKKKNISVRQIGDELAVATVLEGSVRRDGSAMRLTAQLIDVRDGYHLWSKTYDPLRRPRLRWGHRRLSQGAGPQSVFRARAGGPRLRPCCRRPSGGGAGRDRPGQGLGVRAPGHARLRPRGAPRSVGQTGARGAAKKA